MNRTDHTAVIGDGVEMGSGNVIGPYAVLLGPVKLGDVPPFSLAYGNPCRVRSANRVGMQRAGIPDETIDALDKAYSDGLPDDAPRDASTAWAWSWWDQSHADTA